MSKEPKQWQLNVRSKEKLTHSLKNKLRYYHINYIDKHFLYGYFSTRRPRKKLQKRRLRLRTKRKNGKTFKPGGKKNDRKPRPLVPNENRKRKNEKQQQKLLKNSERYICPTL